MWRPRIIPCLLLKDAGLVKGVRFKDHRYIGDPLNAVKIFNDKEVDELLFLDISATTEGRCPDIDLIQALADECYMPFAIGGGIRTLSHIRTLLQAGAEKVVLNTAAVQDPELIVTAAQHFGSQSIIVAVDVRRPWSGRRRVWTHNATRRTSLDPLEWIRHVEQLGAGEVLVNAVDRDGSASGYDVELLTQACRAVHIPVLAGCGAGNPEHLREALHAGASAATAGSLFVFHGRRRGVLINFPDAEELDDVFEPCGSGTSSSHHLTPPDGHSGRRAVCR